jgi:electron transfer flavoprotein beta subunit
MIIAVCIKQVPTREWQPRVDDSKTWIREADASFEMNEPDAYALEEALRLKEKHGGEVVVCSAGPTRVAQVLREALARGADRAIHVEDERFASADAFATSEALAAAMREEKFDLILTGLQSDDHGFAQVGVVIGDGGKWLRRQCLIMAKTNNTPVPFWLSLPLSELIAWIRESNHIVAEAEAHRHK